MIESVSSGGRPLVMVYGGASGHLEEIDRILQKLKRRSSVVLVTNRTEFTQTLHRAKFVPEYGPSILGQGLSILVTALLAGREMLTTPVEFVLATGPAPAIGVLLAAKFARIPNAYIDTLCRIDNLSTTGKIAAFLSDVVFVQWPHLSTKAGRKGTYWGRVL